MQVLIGKNLFIVVVNDCLSILKSKYLKNQYSERANIPNHRWYFDNRFLAVISTVC